MRLYPDVPSRRFSTLASDLLVLLLLVLFAWLGLEVHDAVDRLAVLGHGVRETGSAIQSGFDSAADAVDDVPLVGGKVADGLRGAGQGTGGDLADLGRSGEDSAHRLANLLGLLTFALPSLLLLLRFGPDRLAQVRRLTAATRVLAAPDEPERRRTIAMRAAFALPYGRLLEHTRDPLGDLAAGRYDALVAAALDDAGLRVPQPGRR
jgi:hypothetical protein